MSANGFVPTCFAPAERVSQSQIHDQAQLFEGFTLLNSVIHAVPDVVIVLNEQRQIVYANEAAYTLPNVTPEELLGLRPGEALDCIHASASEGGCGTTEFCRTCGAAQTILVALRGTKNVRECRIVRADGTALDLRVQGTPLNLSGQNFIVFVVQDISHEKRRRALERIFFHDILNTASILKGFVDIMDGATADECDLARTHLARYANRLIDEISAQRELAAAEAQDFVVHFQDVNAQTLLEDMAHNYAHHPAAHKRHIVLLAETQPVVLKTDPTLLGRVLGNMIKNALEACQEGETVTLSCAQAGGRAAFSVHNPGFMPRSVQLQVFQRSFSTKGEGRGLGTYSMRLLSERYLGGWVTFTSLPNDGTTFVASYPITPAI